MAEEVETRLKRLKEIYIKPPEAEVPDPDGFLKLVHWHLDSWQREIIDTLLEDRPVKIAALCGRQVGKSETAALYVAYRMQLEANTEALCISPSLRQSTNIFRKVLKWWRRSRVIEGKATALSLQLVNGSTCFTLPSSSDKVRGYSANVVVIDEASRVEPDVWVSVLPAMSAQKNPKLLLLTTGAAKHGDFYEEWTNGVGYNRWTVPSSTCPRISAENLEDARRKLGTMFAAEHECGFIEEGAGNIFTREMINRCYNPDVDTSLESRINAALGEDDYADDDYHRDAKGRDSVADSDSEIEIDELHTGV
jgi:hypothetical protein